MTVTEAEFVARLAVGLFAMDWCSHGFRYGIGCELDFWLTKGCKVVMNGSREYLQEARRRYPSLNPVLVNVSPDVLDARLRARGRETEEQLGRRMERAGKFISSEGGVEIIQNDGELVEAGERFIRLLAVGSSSIRTIS